MNSLTKKCLVFEAYPFFSGSQRITLNTCKILKKYNFHITLLLVDDRYQAITKNFEGVVDEIKFIEAAPHLLTYGDEDSWFSKKKFFKSVFGGLLPFYINCLKIIKSKEYDYLYCCDPRGACMMLLSAWLFKKKAILHFHGKNRLPAKLSKIFLKVFDEVLCVSQDVADSLPVAANKKVIYNGIDFTQYQNIDTASVQSDISTSLLAQKTKFLYAGLLRPQKGLHHLINAFAALKEKYPAKEFILFVLGAAKTPAEENFRDSLIAICKQRNMEKDVYWLGWKNNVLAWMTYADYFVFPSIDEEDNNYEGFGKRISSSEGLPTVLIESSICSLYTIASGVTGVNEIIDGQNGIVYNSNDGTALYNSLTHTLNELPQFKAFKRRDNFSLQTFETKIKEVFEIY